MACLFRLFTVEGQGVGVSSVAVGGGGLIKVVLLLPNAIEKLFFFITFSDGFGTLLFVWLTYL